MKILMSTLFLLTTLAPLAACKKDVSERASEAAARAQDERRDIAEAKEDVGEARGDLAERGADLGTHGAQAGAAEVEFRKLRTQVVEQLEAQYASSVAHIARVRSDAKFWSELPAEKRSLLDTKLALIEDRVDATRAAIAQLAQASSATWDDLYTNAKTEIEQLNLTYMLTWSETLPPNPS